MFCLSNGHLVASPVFRALNLQQKGQKEALLYLCPVVCAISHSTEGQTESSIPCLRSKSFQDGLPLSLLRATSSSLPSLQGAQVNTEGAAPTGALRPDPHSAQDSRWTSSAGLGTDTHHSNQGMTSSFGPPLTRSATRWAGHASLLATRRKAGRCRFHPHP